jgi:hypothetical protein
MSNGRRRELTPRELQRLRRKEQIKRRRLVAAVSVLAVIIVIIVVAFTTCGGDETGTTTTTGGDGSTSTTELGASTFTAELTGEEAVPAVDTTASGTFTLTYDPDAKEMSFEVTLEELDTPTVANIYQGSAGESGTVVYVLTPEASTDTGPFSGRFAFGTINPSKFTGPLEGKTIEDLVALIRDGNAYVSVGTKKNPIDAIRAQIVEDTSSSSSTETSDGSGSTDSTDDTSSTDDTGSTSTTSKSSSSKTTTTTGGN